MAYKVFQNGFPLNASELNNYLMNQSVMVFASTTARDADLTAPTEGMIVWLQDSNKFVYYNGSGVWIDVNVTGNGANAIINGAFDIWQRGTSIATGAAIVYTADRFRAYRQGLASGMTVSRQDGTLGLRYAARIQRDSGNTSTGTLKFQQDLETVSSLQFAGNAVTLSFYGRAGANYSSASNALSFGAVTGTGTDQSQSGGFTGAVSVSSTATLTTSWQRFSYTFTPASNTTQIGIFLENTPVGTAGAADYFEVTGIQLELGSTATAFKRNASNIQGELAACQRYYWRYTMSQGYQPVGFGVGDNTGKIDFQVKYPVTMRTSPTSIDYGLLLGYDGTSTITVSSLVGQSGAVGQDSGRFLATMASSATQYRAYHVVGNGTPTPYFGLNAEL